MNTGFVNNIIIAGFPGGGKTFVMMYIVIYDRSKGLTVIIVSMMYHWAIQLGWWHCHKLLWTPVDRGNIMSVYRMTSLAIQILERFPNIIEFIRIIHMIANDKIGQTPAKFDDVIDNIFKVVCGIHVQKGNKFLLETYDPTQLQPIRGRPFLVCYSMLQNNSYQKSCPRTRWWFFRIQ